MNILLIGFGPLGRKIYAMSLERPSESIVGVIDRDPGLHGKDCGVLAGLQKTGMRVGRDINAAIQEHHPEVAVVSTTSDLESLTPLAEQVMGQGLYVVSTCEELLYPHRTEPELANRLHETALKNQVGILGTGVNPGFLMDALPAFLTAVCSTVDKVEVFRVQDAQFRRRPFQEKIGAGLNMNEFQQKRAQGTLRHVGLTESMHFIASLLGWNLDHTEDIISPVLSEEAYIRGDLVIPAGHASGVRQEGKGFIDGKEKITLVFQASVGEPESYDEVKITGEPSFSSRIQGGINGDIATCAITLNAAHEIVGQKGLRTMADVGMISCRNRE